MRAPQWEYKSVQMDVSGFFSTKLESDQLDAELNALGAEGWELVSAFDLNSGHGRSSGVVALFKRPRN